MSSPDVGLLGNFSLAAPFRARTVHPLLWVIAVFFLAYFAIGPVESWLGVR